MIMAETGPGILAQTDSLIMTNGESLSGEIKSLDRGVIIIETDYSDSDFKLEWDKVASIRTERKFLIINSSGDRYYGQLISEAKDPSNVIIDDVDIGRDTVNIADVIFFKEIDDTFWSRVDLLMSIGYTLAKANNSHQFSANIKTGYTSSTFGADLYFKAFRSLQTTEDVTAKIKRTEGGLGFRYFVFKDWFGLVRSDLLQSSELKLNIRAITQGGIGYFPLKTNRMELGIAAGAAWNFEDYDDLVTMDRNSAEAFFGVDYTVFNLGDLDLSTLLLGYPSLTESKRFRSDLNFNVKYEFPLDFFIDFGFTLNYDNQPVEGAPSSDYVLQATFGWEL